VVEGDLLSAPTLTLARPQCQARFSTGDAALRAAGCIKSGNRDITELTNNYGFRYVMGGPCCSSSARSNSISSCTARSGSFSLAISALIFAPGACRLWGRVFL
jgi:hypothetical protein